MCSGEANNRIRSQQTLLPYWQVAVTAIAATQQKLVLQYKLESYAFRCLMLKLEGVFEQPQGEDKHVHFPFPVSSSMLGVCVRITGYA